MTASTNAKLRTRLNQPVDIASLAVFRILFGSIMVWEVWRYFDHDWIPRYYIAPIFHFTYYGFSWVTPWPGHGMYIHFAVLGLLGAMIATGVFYRVAAALYFLGFTYVYLLDQTQYLNHFYLVSLMSFLIIFIPAHRAASIDAWWRPKLRAQTAPAWSLWLLRFQLFVVYFYAGIAKLNADWLRGEPARMWLASRDDTCLVGPFLCVGRWFTEEWFVYLYAYGGLVYDLAIVPLLLWRRTRLIAWIATIFFHLSNYVLFNIGIFPWLMLAATTLFLPPNWPRRVFNWPAAPSGLRLPPSRRARLSRTATGLLAIYVFIQIAVPLRHHLYPGDVDWTEEGHRFSWHMKLRDKSSQARFHVRDPETGETFEIALREYLTPRQIRKMSGRPDMILQFAHYLAEQLGREGRPDAQVYAEVESSLNGRRRQPLIDPETDLAAQPRNLRHAPWILPLTEPLVPE